MFVIVDVTSVGFVSMRVACRVRPPPTERLERWTIGVLVGLLDVVAVSQLTAALTVFSRGWVLAAHIAVAAGVAAHGRLRPVDSARTAPSARPSIVTSSGRVTAGAVIGLAAALALIGVVAALWRSTSDYDTLNYHLPNAIHLVRTGSIWGLPITVPPYGTNAYPSNGELLGAWLMLPTHNPALALLEPLPFAALGVLGVALTAKRLGGNPFLGAGAALAIVGSPTFYIWVDSMLTDFAGGAGLITGVALVLGAGRADTVARRHCLVLAGLAMGLSVGAKDTAAGPAVVAVCLVWWLAPRRHRWRDAAVFAVAVAGPAAIWYVRDWVELGNPLFPAGLHVFGVTVFTGLVGFATRYETPLSYHLLHLDTAPLHVWLDGVRNFLGPIIIITAAASIVAVKRAARRQERVLGAVAIVAVVWTIGYVVTPTTGGGVAGNPVLITAQLRYDLPALLVGAALIAVVLRPWLAEAAIAACVAFDIYKVNSYTGLFQHAHRQAGLLVAGVLVGPVVAVVLARRPPRSRSVARRYVSVGTSRRATLAASVSAGGAIAAGVILHSLPVPAPSALSAATDGRPATVVVADIKDVNSVIGPQLANRVVSVQGSGLDGEDVTDPRRALRAAIAHHHPQALVLGGHVAVPAPYEAAGTLRSPHGAPVGTIYTPTAGG